jgi:hypothetical protein
MERWNFGKLAKACRTKLVTVQLRQIYRLRAAATSGICHLRARQSSSELNAQPGNAWPRSRVPNLAGNTGAARKEHEDGREPGA